ncbi:MAG: FAD-binding protein [Deltaproteobacteria bacterium]|nr:FAD-binding protein [Deltaproteobacteria bacterium]MBW2359616.1 FAD-binding protein [Deltaproteobacteria bacterium]
MTDTNAKSWDQEVDVLVVGSGAGAMAAALRAHDLGARTLVIEKTDRYGGASAMGSCLLWIPNNHLMSDVGVDDSPEEAWDYLKGTTAGVVSDDRLKAYLDNAPLALQYLCEKTRAEFVAQPAYPDYYPRVSGSKPGGRSIEPAHFDARKLGDDFLNMRDQNLQMQVLGRLAMTALEAQAVLTGQPGSTAIFIKLLLKYAFDIPFRFKSKRDRNCAMGNALIGMLRLSLTDRGIPLWLNTPARELIVEDGRVTGASVTREGRALRIRAHRAVILAAGGFEGSQAMREKYLPHPTRAEWTCANEHNTGDVIEMGMRVGAGVDLMDDAWWGPVSIAPGEGFARMFVIEKSLPGSMLVSGSAERFTNEGGPYIDIVNAMYANHSEESPCVPAYLVFDATFRKKYICGPMLQGSMQPDWMVRKLFELGYVKKSNTLRGLAAQLGLDAAKLEATAGKLNEYARTGKDLDFQRGDTIYDRYYGDENVQPNPCLAPIEKPPFYAIETFPGELGTKGGLKVDALARVVTDSEDVIPGLYALGNCSSSVMGHSYPGAGATIGPATTFGYIAASDAMTDRANGRS